jgi:hypothetical protein
MEKCFWVADAFRVTWIGRTCNERDIALAQAEEKQRLADGVTKATEDGAKEQATLENTKATGTEDGAQEQATSENSVLKHATSSDMTNTVTKGSISMAVTTSKDHADLKLKMESLGVIETALEAHFGYKSVNVLSLDITSARRLGFGEPSLASNYRIDAVFEGHGSGEQISNGQMLTAQFQSLLDEHEAGIQVKSVQVSFDSPQTEQPTDVSDKDAVGPYTRALLYVAVAVGLASGMLVLFLILRTMLRTMKKSADKKTAEQIVTESGSISTYPDDAKDPEKAVESKEEKKEEDVVSVSTAPPTDSEACSETGSVTHATANNSETHSNVSDSNRV